MVFSRCGRHCGGRGERWARSSGLASFRDDSSPLLDYLQRSSQGKLLLMCHRQQPANECLVMSSAVMSLFKNLLLARKAALREETSGSRARDQHQGLGYWQVQEIWVIPVSVLRYLACALLQLRRQ